MTYRFCFTFLSFFMLSSIFAMPEQMKKKPTPQEIEKAVKDLVGVKELDMFLVGMEKPDPHVQKVLLFGFEAVPALMDQLKDERLTKAQNRSLSPFQARNGILVFDDSRSHYQVRQIVTSILEGLAGEVLKHTPRNYEYCLSRPDVERWWKKARKVGEEAYLIQHVLDRETAGESRRINIIMLEIISRKYPGRLPELYLKLLQKRPEMWSEPLTKAIRLSSLPIKQKRELFLCGAKHENLGQQVHALRELAQIDIGLFEKLLLPLLEKLPRKALLYDMKLGCPEERLIKLVGLTNKGSIWKALEKAAKDGEVGLRLQIIYQAGWSGDGETLAKTRKNKLRFLANFLEDKTVRNLDPKFFGPYDFWEFPKIEVRNAAAFMAGEFFDLVQYDKEGELIAPSPEWTAAQWRSFRQQVRKAWNRKGF